MLPDLARGVALLGIVVVNAPILGISALGYDDASVATATDRITAFAVTMLAQGKFYLLFSFLFGYSTVFLFTDDGALNRRRARRRLVALLAIGIAHLVFFFIGDILVSYALLGFGLLLLAERSNRTLWLTASLVGLASAGWLIGLAAVSLTISAPAAAAPVLAYDTAMADGGFLDQARTRLALLPWVLASLSLQWGYVFAAFCLGLLAARRGLLTTPHRRWFQRAAVIGLGVGLPLQFATTWLVLAPGRPVGVSADGAAVAASAVGVLLSPVLTLGYLGLLGLLCERSWRPLHLLRPAGQASLTVYLGESILLTAAFSSWGLGLFGRLGAGAVTALAIAAWAVLAVLMVGWLRTRDRGPVELLIARWVNRPPRRSGAWGAPTG